MKGRGKGAAGPPVVTAAARSLVATGLLDFLLVRMFTYAHPGEGTHAES